MSRFWKNWKLGRKQSKSNFFYYHTVKGAQCGALCDFRQFFGTFVWGGPLECHTKWPGREDARHSLNNKGRAIMFKNSMTALTLIVGLTGAAFAADQLPVETLEVDDTIQQVPWKNSDAAQKHPTLPMDLRAAIITGLDNRVSDNGFVVDVDIWDLSFAGSPVLPEDGRFDRLGGFVYIWKSKGTEPDYTFPILMRAVDATAVPVTALKSAMIDAFADETVMRLEGLSAMQTKADRVN